MDMKCKKCGVGDVRNAYVVNWKPPVTFCSRECAQAWMDWIWDDDSKPVVGEDLAW